MGSREQEALGALDRGILLDALTSPVLAVDQGDRICFVNPAAEHFFDAGASHLQNRRIDELLPFGSPLLTLVGQVRQEGRAISEYGIEVDTPRIGSHAVDIQAVPLSEAPGHILVSVQPHAMAHAMDRQLSHRSAARSVTAMAAVLAHEIRNPLSGIRGAAQLLEQNASLDDRALTRLICDETDRICALVDSIEVFSDERPIARGPVNIHEVLERVRRLAQTGFARGLRVVETYDPSLPHVDGNRDQLIQAFLNLAKNAAEAAPKKGGEIRFTTAYRHGVRLAAPSGGDRVQLPLEVAIQDNGAGVPEDLLPHLFEPFVTTKASGTGLGLALVAKIVSDHGGIIECESEPRRTVFRVRLPVHDAPARPRAAAGREGGTT